MIPAAPRKGTTGICSPQNKGRSLLPGSADVLANKRGAPCKIAACSLMERQMHPAGDDRSDSSAEEITMAKKSHHPAEANHPRAAAVGAGHLRAVEAGRAAGPAAKKPKAARSAAAARARGAPARPPALAAEKVAVPSESNRPAQIRSVAELHQHVGPVLPVGVCAPRVQA